MAELGDLDSLTRHKKLSIDVKISLSALSFRFGHSSTGLIGKMRMLLRMKIRILPTHANLSLFFSDSSWYISVVLLYIIAGVVI